MTSINIDQTYLKRLMTYSIFLLSICFSTNSLAETSIIDDVFNAQINSYYSINGFYNFSANQGAQKDLNDINDASDKLKTLVGQLASTTNGTPSAEAFKEVETKWKNYAKLLAQNIKEVKRSGYPDLRLAGEMAIASISLNNSLSDLHRSLLANEKNQPSKFSNMSREAAVNMALMMTKYSARSTSTVSQVYADGTTEVTIDELAKQFDGQLLALMDLAKEQPQIFKVLDTANTAWDFIKTSYINYNENRVNFIVNLYSKQIIGNLTEAISMK
jgi:hypothetical protein